MQFHEGNWAKSLLKVEKDLFFMKSVSLHFYGSIRLFMRIYEQNGCTFVESFQIRLKWIK